MKRGIANTLRVAPPYDEELEGILVFRGFAEAEMSLCRLEQLRKRYLGTEDYKGAELCRQIGLVGRRRAEIISRSPRVGSVKRRQKAEIANWFRIWFESPDLFLDWLSLRKQTGSFQELSDSEQSDDDGT